MTDSGDAVDYGSRSVSMVRERTKEKCAEARGSDTAGGLSAAG